MERRILFCMQVLGPRLRIRHSRERSWSRCGPAIATRATNYWSGDKLWDGKHEMLNDIHEIFCQEVDPTWSLGPKTCVYVQQG